MKTLFVFFFISTLLHGQTDEWVNYNTSNSPLGINWVSAIAIDLDGSKWFSTYEGGLAKLDGEEWTIYDTTNSFLPHNLVWTVRIDSSGTKWIGCGTFYGGLVKYDGMNKTLYDSSNSGLPDNMVHSITFEDTSYIWVGTIQGGVARFDGEEEWIVYNEENSGLPGDVVLCVTIDSEGNKWIGTHDDGMTVFDGNDWIVYNTDNSPLPDNEVIDIAIDSVGNKWIAMEGGGLAKFDGINWELFNTENSGLMSDDLISADFDKNGNLWIGTTFGGLTVYNGKSWKIIDNKNTGLNDESALCTVFDSNGDAWIGTWIGGVTQFKEGVQKVNLNEEPVPYYPLEIGNRWDYSVTNSDSFSISVVGDTTMYNGITYFELSQPFGAGQYLRADNDYVYYYDESDSMDTPVYDFNAPFDEWYNIGLYATENDSPRVMLSQIDTVSIFDYESRLLTFDLDWLTPFTLSLSDDFGPAYFYITPNEPISYSLLGCIISDTTYGYLVSVENEEQLVVINFRLSQNYPNPFNPSTKIEYRIQKTEFVSLMVYDVLGREVTTLVNKEQSAGNYSVIFDASELTSGLYLYKLSSGGLVSTKKMILLK